MRVRDRDLRRILVAPLQAQHWRALLGLLTVVHPGPEAVLRYITQTGAYPWSVTIRTPLGRAAVTLYSRHDLLTVNEIFCRRDYGSDAPELVMDVGANIGLATLFWLTRRSDSRVWCYEPHPRNVERLTATLRGYESRYVVVPSAVGTDAGHARFVTEDSGRYGRLAAEGDLEVEVRSLTVEVARIENVERRRLDLIKLDTEGTEAELVAAIESETTATILWESEDGRVQQCRGEAPLGDPA